MEFSSRRRRREPADFFFQPALSSPGARDRCGKDQICAVPVERVDLEKVLLRFQPQRGILAAVFSLGQSPGSVETRDG